MARWRSWEARDSEIAIARADALQGTGFDVVETDDLALAFRQLVDRLEELAAQDLALGDGVRVDAGVVVGHLGELLGGAVDRHLGEALEREDADAAGLGDGEQLVQRQAEALGDLCLGWCAAEVGVEGGDGLSMSEETFWSERGRGWAARSASRMEPRMRGRA